MRSAAIMVVTAMKHRILLKIIMSYISRQRLLGMRVLATGALLCSCGCASSLLNLSGANAIGSKFAGMISGERQQVVRKEEDNDFGTKVETPLLREYISVTGNNLVALRGVGLVMGLDGTGGDPPPSHLRTELLEEMTRRGIKNPGHILASRNTAVVIVTAYLPAMVREDQRFDVRAVLPPNSEATSLKGGWLLETRLSEEQSIAGRGNVKGHQYAMAHGAILTALGDGGSKKASPAMLRRGSIPGGAVSNTERNLKVILRNENRGLKTSKRIENAISQSTARLQPIRPADSDGRSQDGSDDRVEGASAVSQQLPAVPADDPQYRLQRDRYWPPLTNRRTVADDNGTGDDRTSSSAA